MCARPARTRSRLPLWRCTSGAAAIEFAIVFPVLILFILGTYAIGWTMNNISSVDYALEQTSRMLQLKPTMTQDQLQTAINGKLAQYGKQSVTLNMVVQKDASGSNVAQLTASYPYVIQIPMMPAYKGSVSRSTAVYLSIGP